MFINRIVNSILLVRNLTYVLKTRLGGTCKAHAALPLDLSMKINIEFLFKEI